MPLKCREKHSHFETEAYGHGLLEIAAACQRRVAIPLGEFSQRITDCIEIALHQVQRLANLQHRGGIGNVLRRGAPVGPFAKAIGTKAHKLFDHGQNRIADCLGALLQFCQVVLRDIAVFLNFSRSFCRNDSQFCLDARQCHFEIEILLNAILVGPDAPHRLRAENVPKNAGNQLPSNPFRSSGASCDGGIVLASRDDAGHKKAPGSEDSREPEN